MRASPRNIQGTIPIPLSLMSSGQSTCAHQSPRSLHGSWVLTCSPWYVLSCRRTLSSWSAQRIGARMEPQNGYAQSKNGTEPLLSTNNRFRKYRRICECVFESSSCQFLRLPMLVLTMSPESCALTPATCWVSILGPFQAYAGSCLGHLGISNYRKFIECKFSGKC